MEAASAFSANNANGAGQACAEEAEAWTDAVGQGNMVKCDGCEEVGRATGRVEPIENVTLMSLGIGIFIL